MLLAVAVALLVGAAPAAAETVKARRTANVYIRPGERNKVTTTVRAGKRMKVLGKKGRWYKVKVNGRVGWIVRTNVNSNQARETTKTTKRTRRHHAFVNGRRRKRRSRSAAKSAPKDRYGLDAVTTLDEKDDYHLSDGKSRSSKAERRSKRRSKHRARPKKRARKARPKRHQRVEKKKKRASDEEDDEEDPGGFDDLEDDVEDNPLADEDQDDEDDDGDSGGPSTVVARAEIDLLADQSDDAESVGFAVEGEKLSVLARDGEWVKVETSEGDAGWVDADKVRGAGSQPGDTALKAFASLGYARFAQSFTSDSTMLFGNYDISSGAMALSVAGALDYDYGKDYTLGGELDVLYALSTPGIRVHEGDQVTDTGFQVIDVNLVGKGGYKLRPSMGLVAAARLGVRYQAFQIKNVNDLTGANLASLPSESLKGLVAGAELAASHITDKIAGRLVLDTMLILTSRSQTAGLEDGQVSRAKAVRLGGMVTYQWKPNLQVLAGYQYQWAKTSWEGRIDTSMRKHDATAAERSDATHIFSLGVYRNF